MRSRSAATATAMTTGLVFLAVIGCCLGLITGAPSEPCSPGDGDYRAMIRSFLFLLSLIVVLAAVLSIAAAWIGAVKEPPKSQLFKTLALVGLVTSGILVVAIISVMVLTQKC
jgi:cytochrome bd-type quinol oxidase subunit 2